MFEKIIVNHAPRIVLIILIVLGAVALSTFLTGCSAIESMTDSLGDKAISGLASIQSVTLNSSDAISNGAPAGKVLSIIGDVHSVPVVAQKSETIKDYCVLTVTDTPGWFDFTTRKREVKFTFTSTSSTELQKIFDKFFEQVSTFFKTASK